MPVSLEIYEDLVTHIRFIKVFLVFQNIDAKKVREYLPRLLTGCMVIPFTVIQHFRPNVTCHCFCHSQIKHHVKFN